MAQINRAAMALCAGLGEEQLGWRAAPGAPKVGEKFYQEMAPKVAMDRVEILSVTEKVTVPAGIRK